jgi:hypothetical protein
LGHILINWGVVLAFTEFPHLANKYDVMAVPKFVINE